MKKVMFAAAVAATMFAMGNVVESSTVGYQTLTLYHGMNMVSVNFKNMANPEGYTLDELFPGRTPGLTAFRGNTKADYVLQWSASPEGGSYNGTRYFLYVSAATNDVVKDFTWRQNANTPAPVKIKSGDSFWFYHYGDETVTIPASGEVEFSSTTTPTITIHHGMNMIGAPYAAGLNLALNDANYWKNSGATAFRGNTKADYILKWAGSSTGGAYNGTRYFLYVSATTNDVAKDFTWRQNANTAAPSPIAEMGEGVWYYHYGDNSFTLELPYPYNLQ